MTDVSTLTLEQCLALKLMPDIRFFDEGAGQLPVLTLPPGLEQGLRALAPCGVILFRENLESVAQCRALSAQLREVLGEHALIGIDQEGGRVTRLPRREATSFSGNMALSACAEAEALAGKMAAAQGAELRALGININFVPSLDVNSDPRNPVIHVRSFGDDPDRVTALGAAVVSGIQGVGVAASVKHFPGHGNTGQDSHTHLPRVERSADEARATDLRPFAEVIACADPAMVMTAHIQYPSLDDDCIPGTDIVLPATLSRRILTGILREEWGYGGVVITDALDMGAISQLLTPESAVEACFRAGVDIALMPVLVRNAASLERLQGLLGTLADAVRSGRLDEAEIRASAARVMALQRRYATGKDLAPPQVIGSAAHRDLEQQIAVGSMTLLQGTLPTLGPGSKVHVLMPTVAASEALAVALQAAGEDLEVTRQSLEQLDIAREQTLAAAADVYLMGVSEPSLAAVALGGAEDLGDLADDSPAAVQQALLRRVNTVQRVVVMLYSPYRAPEFYDQAEAVLATYDGAAEGLGGAPGPAYRALASVLCGEHAPCGRLPVHLRQAK